jgi:hypothetical protein
LSAIVALPFAYEAGALAVSRLVLRLGMHQYTTVPGSSGWGSVGIYSDTLPSPKKIDQVDRPPLAGAQGVAKRSLGCLKKKSNDGNQRWREVENDQALVGRKARQALGL